MGSLPTGAVASKKVTEALKGWLSMDGNHAKEWKRRSQPNCELNWTARAARSGVSDPVVCEWKCHRSTDKSYPGDNRLNSPKVHIVGEVWHLDVGSSHPGAVFGPKGLAVRQLKRYASWVQNVVDSSVPICRGRRIFRVELSLVREDRDGRTSGAPVVTPVAQLGS